MSNVLYVWDGEGGVARISTTADRAKGRNLSRDPRAALHVSGAHFWQFAVAEGPVTLSDVVTEPGDEAGRELQSLYDAFYGPQDSGEFYRTAIRDRRLVVRLEVRRIYGVYLDQPPGS
jgi:PPOX class probable F420-dependent enzyme